MKENTSTPPPTTYRTVRKPTSEEMKNAKGRCYECSFRYMGNLPDEDVHLYRLVHGDVIGQEGTDLVQYGHAWVEKNDEFVIDLRSDLRKKPLIVPKEFYYEHFFVVENTLRKYTRREMYLTGLKAGGNYGAWH